MLILRHFFLILYPPFENFTTRISILQSAVLWQRSSNIHNMVKSFLQVHTYFHVHIFSRDISLIFILMCILIDNFGNQIRIAMLLLQKGIYIFHPLLNTRNEISTAIEDSIIAYSFLLVSSILSFFCQNWTRIQTSRNICTYIFW